MRLKQTPSKLISGASLLIYSIGLGYRMITASKEPRKKALEAGANGYLLKDISADDLVWAIRAAHAGRATLSLEAAQSLVETANLPPPSLNLTERERKVLALMIEGLNNTQIVGRLTVSPSTIKSHVSHILSKLEGCQLCRSGNPGAP